MKQITYARAINEALSEEMAKDPSVILMGHALSSGGAHNITAGLSGRFTFNRVLDMPPSDEACIEAALGMAMTGAKPVVRIDGNYLLRCLDVVANQIAINDYMYNSQYNSSLVICADVGTNRSAGAQMNSLNEAAFVGIPGLVVLYPSCAQDAKALLKSAIRYNGPVLFLEGRNLYEEISDIPEAFELTQPIGKAETIFRGSDVSLISYGESVGICKEALEMLNEKNVTCDLIDLRTLYPMDTSMIVRSVKKTGKAVIVHEAYKTAGLGAEISAAISESAAFDYLEAPIMRVCAEDMPVGYAKRLSESVLPDANEVFNTVMKITDKEN